MKWLLSILLTLSVLPQRGFAWGEIRLKDAYLAKRSEYIVIGHLKQDSLVMKDRGSSYEGRATLTVIKTIKGDSRKEEIPRTKEIPIFIAYGLLPVPKSDEASLASGPHISSYNYKNDEPIVLFDDNPSEGDFKIVDDLRKNQIWLLSHGPDSLTNNHVSILGIWSSQDVQPLSRKSGW